jgi:pilus assembly protein CpaB
MLLRIALFGMLAVGFLGAGVIVWVMFAAPAPTPVASAVPPPPPVKSTILVAAHALRGGVLIKPEDLASQEIATIDRPAGVSDDTPQGRGGLTGAMIRRTLGEGQPITTSDVVHPGDHGFLSAVLGPDMRAITVAVDAVTGTAGLIWPGDRVDLILTQTLEDPNLVASRRVAAETVLSDARVIAVDQQIVQGQAPDGTVAPANRTATLEVTAAQAERVLVAGHLGKLSLSVVSADRMAGNAAEAESPAAAGKRGALPQTAAKPSGPGVPGRPTPGVTWAGDVSPALGTGETRSAPVMVRIFQGGSDSKEFHF